MPVKIRPNAIRVKFGTLLKEAHPYDSIQLTGEAPSDWSYYRVIALRADIPNSNGDCFPLAELTEAHKTFLGQHFRLNHDQISDQAVRGKVFDAVLVEHPQGAYPQVCGAECKAHVECLVGIDTSSFPDLIASIDQGNLDVSMGCVCESASCSICGNVVTDDYQEPCYHIQYYKGSTWNGKPVYEIIHKPEFVELSKVEDGADEAAVILERVASKNGEGFTDKLSNLFKVIARRLGVSVEDLEREARLERKPSATLLALRENRQAERYRELIAEDYKYGSTQFDLPKEIADVVLAFGKSIPPEDLAPDGVEDNPHITVKYGIKDQAEDALEILQDLLIDQPPVKASFGPASLFENDDFDVLKYDVKSPALHNLNAKIAGVLDTVNTQDEYVPHVTVAYLKPGRGRDYVGNDDLIGKSVTLDKLMFSGKDGETEAIKLTGKATEASRKCKAGSAVYQWKMESDKRVCGENRQTAKYRQLKAKAPTFDYGVAKSIIEEGMTITDWWTDPNYNKDELVEWFGENALKRGVELALQDGGRIPADVLADYPDLVAKYGKQAEYSKHAAPARKVKAATTYEWVTQQDEKVCESCAAMDGETREADDTYKNGVDRPPLHDHCRCSERRVSGASRQIDYKQRREAQATCKPTSALLVKGDDSLFTQELRSYWNSCTLLIESYKGLVEDASEIVQELEEFRNEANESDLNEYISAIVEDYSPNVGGKRDVVALALRDVDTEVAKLQQLQLSLNRKPTSALLALRTLRRRELRKEITTK